MVIESVFITGSNRGIGLELVKQFIESPNPPKVIIAACRNPDKAQELQELKDSSKNTAIHLVKLEVTNDDEIIEAANYATDVLGDSGLTLLINNAGIAVHHKIPGAPTKIYLDHLRINTVAPIIITDKLLPLLKKAAKMKPDDGLSADRAAVINITGQIGNISYVEVATFLKTDAYRISKNGMNYVTAMLQRSLRDDGILVTAICPGWVQTDMGGKYADYTVTDSCERVIKVINALNENHAGKMLNNEGEIQEW